MKTAVRLFAIFLVFFLLDLAEAFGFSKSGSQVVPGGVVVEASAKTPSSRTWYGKRTQVTPAEVAEYAAVELNPAQRSEWLTWKSKQLSVPVPVLEADISQLRNQFQRSARADGGINPAVLYAAEADLAADAVPQTSAPKSHWWNRSKAPQAAAAAAAVQAAAPPVAAAAAPVNASKSSWWGKSKQVDGVVTPEAAIPPPTADSWFAAQSNQKVGSTSVDPGLGARAIPTQLRNIYVSHGDLNPPFNPELFSYTIDLNRPHDQIALVPEIQHDDVTYIAEADLPIVHMTWAGNKDAFPESGSSAMVKQIDLPDDGSELKVAIDITDPHDSKNKHVYNIRIRQNAPPVPQLKYVDAVDNYGDSVLVDPVPAGDVYVYNVCVNPRASKVTLVPGCTSKASLKIDGHSASSGKAVTLARELDHHTQVVELSCGGGLMSKQPERKYALMIKSDWPAHAIPIPKLVVDNLGKECTFDIKKQAFSCPNPKSDSGKTRIVSFNAPSIKYTIENSRKTTEVRLLNNVATVPFTYASGLKVVGEGCQYVVEWPLSFGGSAAGFGIMQLLGWILAIVLALLLLTLLILVGATSMCGIGVPIGGTEIAATMTLIVQYLCFANFMKGSTILTEMIMPLKWVTLFWPLPWHVGDTLRRSLLDVSALASSYGLELWGDSSLGDVTDIRNACGCLFWCTIALACLLIIHICAYVKFMLIEKDHTFPHRVKLGNWESRCLHWLAFPNCTAAAMILAADITTTTWKVLAGVIIGVYVCWIAFVLWSIHGAVSKENVVWVWNSSIREDGELEDESGYWSDMICDQLVTQPVNRGLCRGFFPYKWISTVADIEPVSVCQAVFERTKIGEDIYPPQLLSRTNKESLYPLAKNPKTVEVLSARASCGMCKGSRLVAGLFRTQWLDILFTYQGLAKVHEQMVKDAGRHVILPLTVKTSQLSGPLSSGANAFFFDGTRVPFVRVADSMFRVLLGVFIGVALASEGYKVDGVMFALVVVLAAALLGYVAATKPYSRKFENWMIVSAMGVISLSACSFCYYAIVRKDPSMIADIFLWLVAGGCFILGAYACFVIFSVLSALICPPLEESRFLEKLANCSCTISDHNAGWAVDVPAYSKHSVKDLRAQCTMSSGRRIHVSMFPSGEEPSFEFSVAEIRQACRTGMLPPPILCLFAPAAGSSLGYRHLNVVESDRIAFEVSRFLGEDAAMHAIAPDIANHIARHLETKGRNNRSILSITMVPPKELESASTYRNEKQEPIKSSSSSSSSSSKKKSRSRSKSTSRAH